MKCRCNCPSWMTRIALLAALALVGCEDPPPLTDQQREWQRQCFDREMERLPYPPHAQESMAAECAAAARELFPGGGHE